MAQPIQPAVPGAGAKLSKTSQQVLTAPVKTANPTAEQLSGIDKASNVKFVNKNQEPVAQEPTKNPDFLKPSLSKYEPSPVTFKLPSGGKSIPKGYKHFLTKNNEIFIRRLSSAEEEIIGRLNTQPEKFLSLVTQCLDRCIKTNIDIKHFMLIDKIPMFLFVLDLTYKKENSPVKITCPACGQAHPKNISIKDILNINYMPDDYQYPLSIVADKSYSNSYLIEFDAPTFEHEKLFEIDNLEAAQLLHNLVINIMDLSSDQNVPKSDWMEIITYLGYEDKIKFRDKITEINQYGVNPKDELICENKGCTEYNQKQIVDIPLDQIFSNIIADSLT